MMRNGAEHIGLATLVIYFNNVLFLLKIELFLMPPVSARRRTCGRIAEHGHPEIEFASQKFKVSVFLTDHPSIGSMAQAGCRRF